MITVKDVEDILVYDDLGYCEGFCTESHFVDLSLWHVFQGVLCLIKIHLENLNPLVILILILGIRVVPWSVPKEIRLTTHHKLLVLKPHPLVIRATSRVIKNGRISMPCESAVPSS